ncbi:MAG: prolyl oligopeptidase family serine peptidase, partial [Thermoleophilia bacterium]|nr:prolyl oligopeptidase family serine peptidase [Thermoleophilia bacterium]
GESGGELRQQMLPWDEREDLRNALTWFCAQPEVDAERIGLRGTSYGGCHVIAVGAHDPRVKVVVNQANGCLATADVLRTIMGPAEFAGFRQMLLHDRIARYDSGEVSNIAIVAPPGSARGDERPRRVRVLHGGA